MSALNNQKCLSCRRIKLNQTKLKYIRAENTNIYTHKYSNCKITHTQRLEVKKKRRKHQKCH